jgi:hypothetical protein
MTEIDIVGVRLGGLHKWGEYAGTPLPLLIWQKQTQLRVRMGSVGP